MKDEYFLPGCMLKFFGIYPLGLNKENLHEKQQAFLMYLMAVVPTKENWNLDVAFQREKMKINEMDIKEIKLSEADKDIARLQGQDLEELKKERLEKLKKQKMIELNERFGIKDSKENSQVYNKIARRNVDNDNLMKKLHGGG